MSGYRATNSFSWPEAAVSIMRDMHGRGESMTVIAAEISAKFDVAITRNAVIGKIHRMGLQRGAEYVRLQKAAQSVRANVRAENDRKRKARAASVTEKEAARLAKYQRLVADRASPGAKVVSLTPLIHPDLIAESSKGIMDLVHSSCRWPLERQADDGSMLFCCNQKQEASSYCEGHAKRAFQKTQTKDQKALDKALLEERRARARENGWRDGMYGWGMGKRFA